MPSNVVKSYAKQSGKSIQEVEAIWNEAKNDAYKKFGEKEDDRFWSYVNAVTKKRCGLSENICTFKTFLNEWENGFFR